jgi:uncharacterized membrane protein
MSKVEDFLTSNQEQQIIDAIRSAEKNTSGEIRVHIEKCSKKEAIKRATEVFFFLKMDETKAKNGVLFYLAVDDKKFAIIGDENINTKVSSDFWENTKNTVLTEFTIGDFTNGLVKGIIQTGEQLKKYYPFKQDDLNELTDEISVG